MRRITAIIPIQNDERRIGRCLETLYPCDDIVIVDCGSRDRSEKICRQYGATVLQAVKNEFPSHALRDINGWLLCVDPRESLTEALAASLFEWKMQMDPADAVSFLLREETSRGWNQLPPQTRLVPAQWDRWTGHFPESHPEAPVLQGDLLRFEFP